MKAKVCLVGEEGVGKTSLIRRFVRDEFADKYIRTMGTKVSKREVHIEAPDNGSPIQLDMMVWDIIGEKEHRALLQEEYFDGAKGVIAVCDVTRQETLRLLEDWIDAAIRHTNRPPPVMILGNKTDLTQAMQVREVDLHGFANANGASWRPTSAKTGENVEAAFRSLGTAIVDQALARHVA
jgi:small GTP-binding protein